MERSDTGQVRTEVVEREQVDLERFEQISPCQGSAVSAAISRLFTTFYAPEPARLARSYSGSKTFGRQSYSLLENYATEQTMETIGWRLDDRARQSRAYCDWITNGDKVHIASLYPIGKRCHDRSLP